MPLFPNLRNFGDRLGGRLIPGVPGDQLSNITLPQILGVTPQNPNYNLLRQPVRTFLQPRINDLTGQGFENTRNMNIEAWGQIEAEARAAGLSNEQVQSLRAQMGIDGGPVTSDPGSARAFIQQQSQNARLLGQAQDVAGTYRTESAEDEAARLAALGGYEQEARGNINADLARYAAFDRGDPNALYGDRAMADTLAQVDNILGANTMSVKQNAENLAASRGGGFSGAALSDIVRQAGTGAADRAKIYANMSEEGRGRYRDARSRGEELTRALGEQRGAISDAYRTERAGYDTGLRDYQTALELGNPYDYSGAFDTQRGVRAANLGRRDQPRQELQALGMSALGAFNPQDYYKMISGLVG